MNLSLNSIFSFLLASLFASSASAFVSHNAFARPAPKPLQLVTDADMVSSVSSSALAHFNNMLVATIDADIANVSDNEFAPIFAGGIMVMFGGVASALIVGAILESSDSYANVIADSYAQGGEDEEFWKGLSEEEKKKTQELLQKIKASKEGGDAAPPATPAPVVADTIASEQESSDAPQPETSPDPEAPKTESAKDPGMFSDY